MRPGWRKNFHSVLDALVAHGTLVSWKQEGRTSLQYDHPGHARYVDTPGYALEIPHPKSHSYLQPPNGFISDKRAHTLMLHDVAQIPLMLVNHRHPPLPAVLVLRGRLELAL
jgi:hypothetical protein